MSSLSSMAKRASLTACLKSVPVGCHSSMEPIFITKNGYGDLVVMSMDKYDELIRKAELYEKLTLAEQQIEKGELLDGDAVFEELTKKYGKKV